MQIFLNKDTDTKRIRQLITALLKSKEVTEIKRFNYIASYTLVENKLKKEQQKRLLLLGIKNQEKVKTLLQKIIGDNFQIIE